MFVKMPPRTASILFITFTTIVSFGNGQDYSISKFLVVSTTDRPSECQTQIDRCTKNIQEALSALNANITNNLQKVKDEIIKETEKLLKMKQEIIDSVQAAAIKTPRDCREVQSKGYEDSGVYRIQPYLVDEEFSVFCDMKTRGGGWTYLVNRVDGSQDFYLNWSDYKNGFGNPAKEYWVGLDHIYHLTNGKPNELLFELVDWDLKKVYAHYKKFKIGSDSDGYKVKVVGAYSGDAGDSFTGHLGSKFSTLDRDQDTRTDSCAKVCGGAWWYYNCFQSHPTGRYVKDSNPVPYISGIHWTTFHGLYYSLKEVRMMIRPLNN